jgi:DNA-binding NarL/FixJ family response regulator
VTRILLADGLTVVRAAVGKVLSTEPDFEVLEAGTTAEVQELAAAEPFDIALVDLELPPAGALEAIESLRGANVIVWSSQPERWTVFEAIRAGASGYLPKEIGPKALVRALRGAERGEAPLSRELTALMIDALHDVEQRQDVQAKAAVLSSREREVLAHIAAGAPNGQIASAMAISPFTVKRHVQNILQKLQLRSRAEAAAFYRAAFEREAQEVAPA